MVAAAVPRVALFERGVGTATHLYIIFDDSRTVRPRPVRHYRASYESPFPLRYERYGMFIGFGLSV